MVPLSLGQVTIDDYLPPSHTDGWGGSATAPPPPARVADSAPPSALRIRGRVFTPTEVFDTYWRFAAARQAMYEARLSGEPGPWTADPILRAHRFTNCFRAADRVSQFLIREVAYRGPQEPAEVAFRVVLFKMFNKIETWQLLQRELGPLTVQTFDVDTYDDVLTAAFRAGRRLYSAAYVVPPPRLGGIRKHSNHLRLLRLMLCDDFPGRLQRSASMREAFAALKKYPSMGDFLAYQFLIDLNYTSLLAFDEMDFVVAGPGARDGIHKCFGPGGIGFESDLIRYMSDSQEAHFDRLGLSFSGLFGRRLQLVDCQNLFCEVDKYARVAHPNVGGLSGRQRIKQRFTPRPSRPTAWFPPKWGLSPMDLRRAG